MLESESEEEVINSTGSVEYNTDSSSDSGIDSDDNESDSSQMPLPFKIFIKKEVEEKLSISF